MIRREKPSLSLLLVAAVAAVSASIAVPVRAATVQDFQALVDATAVSVGESVIYTLGIQSDEELDKLVPVPPDFNGFKVVGQPTSSVESRFTIINGQPQQSIRKTISYELQAQAAGTFVIGPSTLTVNGQAHQTQPLTVTVNAADAGAMPPSFQPEGILNAQSRDRNINKQIRGRMFVRPVVSKRSPYVGEPSTVSYYFYWDRALNNPPIPGIEALPQIQGAQVETLYLYQNQTQPQFVGEAVDGVNFARALLYQIAVTPAAAAPLTIDGFSIKFSIRVNTGDVFGPTSVWVSATGAKVDLQVKALPPVPNGGKFSGTVGALKLSAAIDRTTATQGDILTYKATLEGRGNIAQAYAPVFPQTADFTIFDQTQRIEKGTAPADGSPPDGRKIVEYLLRPARAGALTIPAINYTIFNPESEKYEALATQPVNVQVSPVPQGTAVGAGPAVAAPVNAAAPKEIAPGLRYARPVLDLSADKPEPIAGGFFYWAVQVLFAVAAFMMFVLGRRRDRVDPKVLRRARAAAEFERKIEAMRAKGETGEAAAAIVERALREFFADRANISAEGLTFEDIARRCEAEGLGAEEIAKVTGLLNRCAGVRYAPAGGASIDFAGEAAECVAILKGRAS